ncbi:MAG: methyltransferase domain-containing protein [Thermoplasmata archaeon]|nr:MAG: methyltransferase domain-containing protein [Thermoplasmata archaeon]
MRGFLSGCGRKFCARMRNTFGISHAGMETMEDDRLKRLKYKNDSRYLKSNRIHPYMEKMLFEEVRDVIYPKSGYKGKYEISSRYYHLIMGVFEIRPNTEALEIADIREDEKVLDLAFGTGWLLNKIVERTNTVVYGIDFSGGMCKVSMENLERNGNLDRTQLILGDVLSMPIKDNSFDVVIGSFILDLLPKNQIKVALEETKRVLKPGGRAIFASMTKKGRGLLRSWRLIYEMMYPLWPTILGYRPSSRPIRLSEEVTNAGFRITKSKITRTNFFPFPVEIVVCEKEVDP